MQKLPNSLWGGEDEKAGFIGKKHFFAGGEKLMVSYL